MKNFSLIVFGFAAMIVVSSCGKDGGINSGRDRTFALYKLVYDGAEGGTKVSAEFFDGSETGPKVDLGFTVKAELTFGGKAAEYTPSTFTFFREYANRQNSNKIVYKYTAGNIELTNTISLPREIALPGSLNAITRANGLKFKWGGDPITSREKVTLVIGNKKFVNNVQGTNEFDIPASELDGLPDGITAVHIERERFTEASQASPAGGKMVGIFKSAKRNVLVQ